MDSKIAKERSVKSGRLFLNYPKLYAEMCKNNVSGVLLAEWIGMSKTTMYMKLSGETALTLDNMKAICKVFNKSLSELFE